MNYTAKCESISRKTSKLRESDFSFFSNLDKVQVLQELVNPLPFFKNHLDNFISKKMLELDKFVRSFNLLQIVSHDLIACWHRVKTISKPMLADVDN